VVLPFEQNFDGRYPFDRKGAREASLDEVAKFFQPKSGTVWQYYEEVLKTDIEQAGRTFAPRPNTVIKYRPELLSFLQRAQEISSLLFGGGGTGISVPLEVRIQSDVAVGKGNTQASPFGRTVVTFAGEPPVSYVNSVPQFAPRKWSGRAVQLEATEVSSANRVTILGSGDWGLFRLLGNADERKREKDSEEYLRAFWNVSGKPVRLRVDWKPVTLDDAFRTRLQIPRRIAEGDSACLR
jgi:type VI protein secretion system component VasK